MALLPRFAKQIPGGRPRQFTRFCIVGTINATIDFSVFALLFAIGISLLPAHILSYGCGVASSFMLNRKWTFGSEAVQSPVPHAVSGQTRQLSRFILLNLMTLVVSYFLLVTIHAHWNLPMLASRLCAAGVGLVINFAGNRFWVFQQKGYRSEPV